MYLPQHELSLERKKGSDVIKKVLPGGGWEGKEVSGEKSSLVGRRRRKEEGKEKKSHHLLHRVFATKRDQDLKKTNRPGWLVQKVDKKKRRGKASSFALARRKRGKEGKGKKMDRNLAPLEREQLFHNNQ